MNRGTALGAVALVAVLTLALAAVPLARSVTPVTHYIPRTGDRFDYREYIRVTNGTGYYAGYTELGNYTGSITVTGVLPNGTVEAAYLSAGNYSNSAGQKYPWSENGSFTFSSDTFLYVEGTDNQTGYAHPSVWFYMNNTLPAGATITLLDSELQIVSTDDTVPLPLSSTGYVSAIFAEGNGSYVRNDAYGVFNANYNWKAYFDPSTGYNLEYVYVEQDTNSNGTSFTYTDTLTDTSTSFPLTVATPPPTSQAGGSTASLGGIPVGLLIVIVVVILVVIVLVAVLVLLRRSRTRLPRHPTTAVPGTLPSYAPPASINLIPRDQPPVQQVVIKETVKVPCRYCGTLIDSTATNCPNCGAPRT